MESSEQQFKVILELLDKPDNHPVTVGAIRPLLEAFINGLQPEKPPEADARLTAEILDVTQIAVQTSALAAEAIASPPKNQITTPAVSTDIPSQEESLIINRVKSGDVGALDELVNMHGYQSKRFPDDDSTIVAVWKGNGPTYLVPQYKDGNKSDAIVITTGAESKLSPFFDYERGVRSQVCMKPAIFPSQLNWEDWRNTHDPGYLLHQGLIKGQLGKQS